MGANCTHRYLGIRCTRPRLTVLASTASRRIDIGFTKTRKRQSLKIKIVVLKQSRLLRLILGSAILAAENFCAPLVHAEAIVSGAANNLTIEAHDTSLQDVLNALGAKFDLRVRGLSSLDRRIEGAYRGSLREVVARLLARYDYVLKIDGGRIDVIVVGAATHSETRPDSGQVMLAPTKRRSD